MLEFLKRKKHIPDKLAKGVDIHIGKTVVDDIETKVNSRTGYSARIYSREEHPSISYLINYSDLSIYFPTEEAVAKAISEYLNGIKKEYSILEFDYKLKVNGEKITVTTKSSETTDCTKTVRTTITTTVATKLTDEECGRTAKSIEDMLK